MLKGILTVLSGYLGRWVYQLFTGRKAKSNNLITYFFPGFIALIWGFIAIIGFLGIFFDLGGSTRDAALMFGGCIVAAALLWLACIPLRNAEKKKAAEEEIAKQVEIQKQIEYREANGIAPLLCDVEGYIECPLCHTRQKLGRERCFGCDTLLKKDPVLPNPQKSLAVEERILQPAASETNDDNPVSIPAVKFCRKCGSQLQTDSVFCNKCGTKVIMLQSDSSNEENN